MREENTGRVLTRKLRLSFLSLPKVMEQGSEQEKNEKTKAIAVAMKKKGMPISDIAECTGLPLKEI